MSTDDLKQIEANSFLLSFNAGLNENFWMRSQNFVCGDFKVSEASYLMQKENENNSVGVKEITMTVFTPIATVKHM